MTAADCSLSTFSAFVMLSPMRIAAHASRLSGPRLQTAATAAAPAADRNAAASGTQMIQARRTRRPDARVAWVFAASTGTATKHWNVRALVGSSVAAKPTGAGDDRGTAHGVTQRLTWVSCGRSGQPPPCRHSLGSWQRALHRSAHYAKVIVIVRCNFSHVADHERTDRLNSRARL
jgi:hypothetical protein